MRENKIILIILLATAIVSAIMAGVIKLTTGDGILDYIPSLVFVVGSITSLRYFFSRLREEILIIKFNKRIGLAVDDPLNKVSKIIEKLPKYRQKEAKDVLLKKQVELKRKKQ